MKQDAHHEDCLHNQLQDEVCKTVRKHSISRHLKMSRARGSTDPAEPQVEPASPITPDPWIAVGLQSVGPPAPLPSYEEVAPFQELSPFALDPVTVAYQARVAAREAHRLQAEMDARDERMNQAAMDATTEAGLQAEMDAAAADAARRAAFRAAHAPHPDEAINGELQRMRAWARDSLKYGLTEFHTMITPYCNAAFIEEHTRDDIMDVLEVLEKKWNEALLVAVPTLSADHILELGQSLWFDEDLWKDWTWLEAVKHDIFAEWLEERPRVPNLLLRAWYDKWRSLPQTKECFLCNEQTDTKWACGHF